MKAASVLLFALSPLLASAWKLEIWTSDGRKATMHGTADSGCKNMAFTPVLSVNRAKFSPKTAWHSDPGTFELYANRNCDGLSYREGSGDHEMKARKIRSYKVY